MDRKKLGNTILGVMGALFVGALGSGLWELFLKDAFTLAGRGLMTAFTFGYATLRDVFYEDIAQGRNDRTSLWILWMIVVPIFAVLGFFFGLRRGRHEAVRAREGKSEGEIREKLLEVKARKHKLERVLVLLFAFLASLLVFKAATLSYVSAAVTHFEQSYAICLPYLTDVERDRIRSDFARIKTKGDYERVLSELGTRALANGTTVPKFLVW